MTPPPTVSINLRFRRDEDVQKVLQQYIDALQTLFDKYKVGGEIVGEGGGQDGCVW